MRYFIETYFGIIFEIIIGAPLVSALIYVLEVVLS